MNIRKRLAEIIYHAYQLFGNFVVNGNRVTCGNQYGVLLLEPGWCRDVTLRRVASPRRI